MTLEAKTVSTVFHLHNKSALREFKVSMNGICLKHDPHPVYLGVTLSFKEHTTKTAGKLKSRNNLLSKLAGTSWGASATLFGHLLWLSATQLQSIAAQCGQGPAT